MSTDSVDTVESLHAQNTLANFPTYTITGNSSDEYEFGTVQVLQSKKDLVKIVPKKKNNKFVLPSPKTERKFKYKQAF